MKKTFLLLFSIFLISSCKQNAHKPVGFQQELAAELARMAEMDQKAAWVPQGKYKKLSLQEWRAFKDSVFTTHKLRLEEIFEEFGYPGYELVGKEGEKNFWVMVQHCDFDPAFQQKVLEKLEAEVQKGNASSRNFGLLTDRLRLNTGRKQLYGTQVTYNKETGQAIPRPLAGSAKVNARRKALGFISLEEYLNEMTISHFNMNKENMLKRGITEPQLYEVKND